MSALAKQKVPRLPTAQEQTAKRRLLQLLEEDRSLLMTGQPFTAMLAMQLDLVPVVDDRLPVAGTDGCSIFFNAAHLLARTDRDRRFILAHEVWHCALGHFRRALGRETTLWNAAVDYEVNHLLAAELGYTPADALQNKRFANLSAEEIHARLLAGAPTFARHGLVLDTHDLAHAHASANIGGVQDPDFIPKLALTNVEVEAISEVWRQRVIAAAQSRECLAGSLPGHLSRIVGEIRTPKVAWQHTLRRFVQQQYGGARRWLPPSRRHIHQGLYLPGMHSDQLNIAVALDNSRSCMGYVAQFLSELRGILTAFDRVSLRLLVFDTAVRSDRQFDETNLHELSVLTLEGGGGTDFTPVFDACDLQPPLALLLLTDGFGQVPPKAPPYPVLWALTDKGRSPVEWGETLTLSP